MGNFECELLRTSVSDARHSQRVSGATIAWQVVQSVQRVSGAVLNRILGHPEVPSFAPRNAECPVSRREMRSVRLRACERFVAVVRSHFFNSVNTVFKK